MGRTRGKFTNKVIYIENSGLQPIGGQYLQNVNGILYWNGISIATLPTLAGDVTYDDAGNTYVIGDNVDEALASIESVFSTIVQEGTTASNGLTRNALDIEFGGQLAKDTTLGTLGKIFKVISTVGAAEFYLKDGVLYLKGNTSLSFLPPTISSTSQNKSLQLANTTGNLSLVNKGSYCYKEITSASVQTITIPVANGLVLDNDRTVPTNFNVMPLISSNYQFSSRINNSGVDDYSTHRNFFTTSVYAFEKHRYCINVTVTCSKDCILVPFIIGDETGLISIDIFSGVTGGPQFISGVGYTMGTTCKAGEPTLISLTFEYGGFMSNIGNIGFYRNINGITDAMSLDIQFQSAFLSAQLL